ncbi:MAG: response regulator [Burkholderiales bacterium]|nr:MAG: response regulator [Burkholderiales bacterium]
MRQLHTVKGSARMAGAMRLGQVVHDMETRIEAAANLPHVPLALIEELISDHDRALALFETIRNPEAGHPPAASAGAPATAAGTGMVGRTAALAPAAAAQPTSAVQAEAAEQPVAAEQPAAAAPATGFEAGWTAEHAGVPLDATSKPAQAPAAAAQPAAGQQPAAGAQASVETLPTIGVSSPGLAPAAAQPEIAANAQQLIRVRADLLDRMVNESGEVSIARSRLENAIGAIRQSLAELTENVGRLRGQLREIEIQGESQIQAHIAQQRDAEHSFDPLEFDRYTRFQELTRMLAESVNDVSTVQQQLTRSLNEANQDLVRQAQVTRDLQQNLMRVRMVQFGSIADRLYRVVRLAAKEVDKRVNLELRGGSAEIDRGILERMVGPLEHLLRNAVGHGIEPRAERIAAGKSETGEITIEVRQEGNEVVLSLGDDGGGLDLERIRARAIEAGLMPPDSRPTDRELAEMIFMPGFSTAHALTAMAGRGVGMDVVRSEVAALGGRIETHSRHGAGTRFVVHLPLTLAVTQVVLVAVGAHRFALPAVLVEQVLQIKPEALTSAYRERMVDWQGRRVPFFYLARLLELGEVSQIAQRYSPVIVVRSGSQHVAIHVDTVIGNQEVVVKNVGPQLARLVGMAGATVLGNGDIVLIINPVQLAQRMHEFRSLDGEGEIVLGLPPEAEHIAMPATVMVVDDSLTVRKVTQRLLAREGYQVSLAKDGVDAMRQLQDHVPDVILTDIEMPRMDGFDLTRQIRGDDRLRDVPIVMITSRTAEKHRSHAFALGVDVYLGKPYSEDELIAHVRAFVDRKRSIAVV